MKSFAYVALWLVVSLGLLLSSPALAQSTGCSGFIGQASINELYVGDNRGQQQGRFVELRILDRSIGSDIYSQWRLQLCDGNRCITRPTPDASFDDDSYPWLVLGENHIPADLIDFRANADLDVRLMDGDGNLIDYLSVGGFSSSPVPGCEFVFDTQMEHTNSTLILRSPDGTGDWTDSGPGQSGDEPTKGESNDEDPPDDPFAQVDHFRMVYATPALTCQPADVTIIACGDDTCTPEARFTDPVEVSLSPQEGWSPGNNFTFEGGSVNVTLQRTQPQTVSVAVDASDPPARDDTRCGSGDGPFSPDQCSIDFVDAALAFTVESQRAHRPSGNISIQAVQADDESNACVPAFANVTREVNFSRLFLDPDETEVIGSPVLSLEGNTIDGQPRAVALDFDESGTAQFSLRYDDAGLLRLNALYEGSAATEDEGLMVPGQDDFAVAPQGFCVQTPFPCPAGDASCNVASVDGERVPAGAAFELQVQAVGWLEGGGENLCQNNPPTPNFALTGIPLTRTLVAPADGNPGDTGTLEYDHEASNDARQTLSQSISEVGVFRFGVDPSGLSYFGTALPAAESVPTERFTPDRFQVMAMDGRLSPTCEIDGPFAYIGEPVPWSEAVVFEIQALNVPGDITENYTHPDFIRLSQSRLDTRIEAINARTAQDAPYPLDREGVAEVFEPQVSPGIMALSLDGALVFEKLAERVTPQEPSIAVALAAFTDTDAVAAGEETRAEALPEPDFPLRYGRIRLDNVFGPEGVVLDMPVRAEFWNGERFVIHRDDTAEDLSAGEGCFVYNPLHQVTVEDETVAENRSEDRNRTLLMGQSEPGDGILLASARETAEPGNNSSGITLAVPEWLQSFNEQGERENPTATATFGVYRGHDRIIYWRELSP